jgi:hypothetical protein
MKSNNSPIRRKKVLPFGNEEQQQSHMKEVQVAEAQKVSKN